MSGASPSDETTREARPRVPRGRTLAVGGGLVVAVLVGVVVLADTGTDGDGEDRGQPTTTESAQTTTTEPPGTEPAEVQPYVEELIVHLDEVTDQIVRNPTVVNDPSSELIAEFTTLYAPSAEGLIGGLNAFRQSAAAGTHLEPVNAATTGRTVVTGTVETIDSNTVKVAVCNEFTYRKVDADGNVLEYIATLSQPGEVFAVRVDGQWRLERSDVFDNTICTAEEGGSA